MAKQSRGTRGDARHGAISRLPVRGPKRRSAAITSPESRFSVLLSRGEEATMFTISGAKPRAQLERRKSQHPHSNTLASLDGDRTRRGGIPGGDAALARPGRAVADPSLPEPYPGRRQSGLGLTGQIQARRPEPRKCKQMQAISLRRACANFAAGPDRARPADRWAHLPTAPSSHWTRSRVTSSRLVSFSVSCLAPG